MFKNSKLVIGDGTINRVYGRKKTLQISNSKKVVAKYTFYCGITRTVLRKLLGKNGDSYTISYTKVTFSEQ